MLCSVRGFTGSRGPGGCTAIGNICEGGGTEDGTNRGGGGLRKGDGGGTDGAGGT